LHAIPAGESSKTPAQAAQVLSAMASAGVTRADVLAAVGGGVVGDVGGFCAAVYQRGLRWVGVPTTLVAQVDSAFGGKTGVDLPEGKNYMGVYHQPAAVIVDPDTLKKSSSTASRALRCRRPVASPAELDVASTPTRLTAVASLNGRPIAVLRIGTSSTPPPMPTSAPRQPASPPARSA
jgi:hypothetical protein